MPAKPIKSTVILGIMALVLAITCVVMFVKLELLDGRAFVAGVLAVVCLAGIWSNWDHWDKARVQQPKASHRA